MKKILIGLISLYQRYVSPFKKPCCRFYPTCSQYAIAAIEKYGAFKGGFMAIKRICKCHPFHPGGYDPVKEKKAQFIQLDESCYILEYRNNTDRPNIVYIYDPRGSVLIDSGNSNKHIKHLYKEIKKRNLNLLKLRLTGLVEMKKIT